jgi:hypothetical protein
MSREGLPKRAAILAKSTMTSTRSATPTRALVTSTGRPSRQPSGAITQNGIDWLRSSGLVRKNW